MINSTFWKKNMIDSAFWEQQILIDRTLPKTRLAAPSGKKHDWQRILGKNMIDNTFLGKKHDWQHILGNEHEL
jgi:hypothetical protein